MFTISRITKWADATLEFSNGFFCDIGKLGTKVMIITKTKRIVYNMRNHNLLYLKDAAEMCKNRKRKLRLAYVLLLYIMMEIEFVMHKVRL